MVSKKEYYVARYAYHENAPLLRICSGAGLKVLFIRDTFVLILFGQPLAAEGCTLCSKVLMDQKPQSRKTPSANSESQSLSVSVFCFLFSPSFDVQLSKHWEVLCEPTCLTLLYF